MGHKIHPVGLRLGITRTWDSRWFEKKHYIDWLHEDVAIRKFFNKWQRSAGISKIEIERRANQARVIINTAKPGIIIGKRGVGIEDIRQNLEKLTRKNVQVNVMEIKHPEIDARLVAQNIVDQLEKRIAFRRAMKQAIMRTMKAGALGVKVQVSGRLGGAEIARTERNKDGKVPLHTLRADIDYAHVEAFTTFGRIGVKVWVYRGEVLPDQGRSEANRERERSGGFRERRERGGRGGRSRAPQPVAPAPAPEVPGVAAAMEAAPTVEEAPAPIVEEAPAPIVEEAPAPIVEEAPAPLMTEPVAPAVEETPAPPVNEPPTPIGDERASADAQPREPVVESAAPSSEGEAEQ